MIYFTSCVIEKGRKNETNSYFENSFYHIDAFKCTSLFSSVLKKYYEQNTVW